MFLILKHGLSDKIWMQSIHLPLVRKSSFSVLKKNLPVADSSAIWILPHRTSYL